QEQNGRQGVKAEPTTLGASTDHAPELPIGTRPVSLRRAFCWPSPEKGGRTLVTRLTYTLDCCDAEKLAAFWCEVLGYSLHGPRGSFWPLVPPDGLNEPWFVLQQVGEPRSG